MKPLVNVIIPVYNVEKFLRDCLDSVVNQTYENIEVICVNDGSTDNSLSLLKEYEAKYTNVKVIIQENQGLSSARNTGLYYSTGKYVVFLDSDDWMDLEAIELAVETAEAETADIVFWSYIREFENESKKKEIFNQEKIIFENDELAKLQRRQFGLIGEELKRVETAEATVTAWGKLYKTDILIDNELQYTDLKIIGTLEDGLFNMEAFRYASKIVYLNKYWNHYRKTNSQSLTTKYRQDFYSRLLNLFDKIQELIDKNKLSKEYQLALNNRISLSILGAGLNVLAFNGTAKTKRKMLKEILSSQTYQNAVKTLKLKYFKLHWKLFYWCAKHRRVFTLYILLLVIKRIIHK